MTAFLVDEGCDAVVIRQLRSMNFDVLYVAEKSPGKLDAEILAWSYGEKRILITEDQDFSKLVFRDSYPTYGIILIRIADTERLKKAEQIALVVDNHINSLVGSIITVFSNRIKIRPLPSISAHDKGET